MLYDSIVLLGILMFAVALIVLPYQVLLGTAYPHDGPLHRIIVQIVLVLTLAGFFLYFWTHGGQTLGARAWRFRLLRDDGADLDRSDALSRLLWATAFFGPAAIGLLWLAVSPDQAFWTITAIIPAALCLLWTLIDRDGLAWHDRLSRTRPVMLKKGS